MSPSWVACPITGGDTSEGWGWDSHNGLKLTQNPSGWQRDRQRQGQHHGGGARPVPTFSWDSGAMCSFSRHSRLAAGQHKACAIASVLLAQRLGPLPSPTTGLPPAPSTMEGEWKLHPARGRGDVGTGQPWQNPSAHTGAKGCPKRPLNLPPSVYTAHVHTLPCHPSTHIHPFTPRSQSFSGRNPLVHQAQRSVIRCVGCYQSAHGPVGSTRLGSWR